MSTVEIDRARCRQCTVCMRVCPAELFGKDDQGFPEPLAGVEPGCIGCGHCLSACPHGAISLGGVGPWDCTPIGEAESLSPDVIASLVKQRRSTRDYLAEPVDRETVEWLLDLARWAPSARNAQPVHWTVLDGTDKVHALGDRMAEWLRAEGWLPELVDAWDRGVDRIFRNAPHLLIAHARCGGAGSTKERAKECRSPLDPAMDCVIAATTVELAAHARGLGACWAGYFMYAAAAGASFVDDLGLPKGHRVCAALMLGLPRHRYRLIPPRKESRVKWL